MQAVAPVMLPSAGSGPSSPLPHGSTMVNQKSKLGPGYGMLTDRGELLAIDMPGPKAVPPAPDGAPEMVQSEL